MHFEESSLTPILFVTENDDIQRFGTNVSSFFHNIYEQLTS